VRLQALLRPLLHDPGLARALDAEGPLSVADVAKPALLAALHQHLGRPLLVVAARPAEARRYADEIALWSVRPNQVLLFPEPDALPYESLPENPETTAERLGVLVALSSSAARPLVVCCVRALMDRLAPAERFRGALHVLRVGDRVAPGALLERWLALGYEPSPVVDGPGQIARRGGILDIFPPAASIDGRPAAPYRIEFFGDEVDSIRLFDPATQRSLQRVEQVEISAAHDHASATAGSSCLLDYLPSSALVVLDEPERLEEVARDLERQAEELRAHLTTRAAPDAERPYFAWGELQQALLDVACRELIHDPDRETLPFTHLPTYGGRLKVFLDELLAARERAELIQVIVSQQTARLDELLRERGVFAPLVDDLATLDLARQRLVLVHGSLEAGFAAPALGFALLTDAEIFGWSKPRRVVRRRRAAARATFLADLEPGDWVVHVDHGIGRFQGLVRSGENGEEREFLLLEYAAGDRLYVPVDQADRVTRYVGAGDYTPQPTRLGTSDWARAKQRVRRAVRDIARDLIELYAARAAVRRPPYSPDTSWQLELEAAFPYVETPDQVRAIEAVKDDMQGERPMDRLLVGDVGYGKTEVAIRAAFKAVSDGRQVAVLVPTTVLAQQHFTTFRERLSAFPVRVEMLSRFLSEREQREVLEGLKSGAVDICIGTHRLIQKDVAFKNLGLVIIDEEQRFGVAHKERLKQLRREVDVLTMTATPIPRTLHMSLVGVRDMSTIDTAPEERLPIRTYLGRYDEELVREAILRELDRGGQVYFVHNRVEGIESVAARLARLVPEARIAVGHGQMPEDQLEQVMLRFAAGETDLLVCTTIIESGLDIPNVNTIIINNAHRFGLSQLYQLRGRVGRGAARAYAYLLWPREAVLTEEAEKRLRTIFEATELGAGFRIAMKDLEIRGAGNLLGAEQHGNISAVGFELYTQLLGEAVQQLKAVREGQPVVAAPDISTAVDLPLSALIPPDYVQDAAARLNLYQRLAACREPAALAPLVEELEDRFGPLPEAVQNLVYVASLRLRAAQAGVAEIAAQDGEIVIRFRGAPPLSGRLLSRQLGVPVKEGSNQLRFPRGKGQGWLATLDALVERLREPAAPSVAVPALR